MLGASCSSCCSCNCGASVAVEPWRPYVLSGTTARPLDASTYGFDGPNMFPELCCSGAYTPPSFAVSVTGGAGNTVQQLRDMSGTYVTQPYVISAPFISFDTRWNFTVSGFQQTDGKFQSELPPVGSPFSSYWAFSGQRRTLTFSEMIRGPAEWYYEGGAWQGVISGSEPYYKTTTSNACGCLGQGSIVNNPGQICINYQYQNGYVETTTLFVYVTRRVATARNTATWVNAIRPMGTQYLEELKTIDRTDTRTVVRVSLQIRFNGACYPFAQVNPGQTVVFVWQGDVVNKDSCSLSCQISNMPYMGLFAGDDLQSTFNLGSTWPWYTNKILRNFSSPPTVSIVTV
jgi:hypothetical protein